MKKIALLVAAFVTALGLAGCQSKKLPVKTLSIHLQNGGTVTCAAEIADTPETREHGFMEREKIPDGTGMLFVFDRDQILSFWMKNTPHPLSIAYLDAGGRIRDIFDMKPYSLKSIVSTVSCRYALEVPQGWFSRAGVSIGDTVDLSVLR